MKNQSKKTNLAQVDQETPQPDTNLSANNTLIYALLGIAMFIVLLARMHLISFPFERDEGEYAYMGKLILDGHPPYSLAYNMKFPGTYYMYAIFMALFGNSITGVHTGLLIITLISMFFVFRIATHFVSKVGAVISAASFGIMGTSWTLLAQAGHATHFVVFFALAGTLMILESERKDRYSSLFYFLSGLAFSLAFICKQSGLFFTFFGIGAILFNESKPIRISGLVKKITPFLLGFLMPVMVMFVYFYAVGNFDKFWFWTVEYLSKYSEQISISEAPHRLKLGLDAITALYSPEGYIGLWVVAVIGIPFLYFQKTSFRNKVLLGLFVLLSFLTIVPGYNFRQHYFITLLPAVGLSVAIFFDTVSQWVTQRFKQKAFQYAAPVAFVILIGFSVRANADYLFERDPDILCKQLYDTNPFLESIDIARFIEEHSTASDKIAVLGSEPQICFYAHRYAATGYIYTYNLVELHSYALAMQKEMIREIETSKPTYLVYVDIEKSWMYKPASERMIFDWSKDYIKDHFKLVGMTELFSNQLSVLKTGNDLDNYKPQSKDVIYIYERI